MPKEAEKTLRATAEHRGYGKKRANAYVYGGLRRMGWRPKSEARKHLTKD